MLINSTKKVQRTRYHNLLYILGSWRVMAFIINFMLKNKFITRFARYINIYLLFKEMSNIVCINN